MKANTTKKMVVGIIKKTAEKFASYACGSASICGLRQPKEPENLKNILKK
ncbi:cyclic lactone autoinducer peptide [uncultured Ruminococcus sp.]|nr:cyclic lactone autoinducer peptide [uncultured Ruminococcus sp.]